MGPLPRFIIVGAPRSGTSSLNYYLGQHPEISMSIPKEVHFFDRHWDRGLEWYSTHFHPKPGQTCGEATPGYLYQHEALERIGTALPDVKLVVTLRNPVNQTYSMYLMSHSRGRDPRPFDQAANDYLPGGQYVDHLSQLPDRPLHVIIAERLFDNPESEWESLCRFLRVSPYVPADLGRRVNSYFEVRSMTLRRIGKSLPRSLRRISNAIGKVNHRVVDPPRMDPEIRQRLEEHFSPYNAALSEWLDDDLSEW